jgi:hypothetical protein
VRPAGALRERRLRRPASGVVTYAELGITSPEWAETRAQMVVNYGGSARLCIPPHQEARSIFRFVRMNCGQWAMTPIRDKMVTQNDPEPTAKDHL